MLKGVTRCYKVLHHVKGCCTILHGTTLGVTGTTQSYTLLQGVSRCYNVLQYVARCYNVLHFVAGCYKVFYSFIGCCTVLQGVVTVPHGVSRCHTV